MPLLELACGTIVTLYVVARSAVDPKPRSFVFRMLILMTAAWVAENSVIEAYAFYDYSPRWSAFVHHVPLMIVFIWPVVIHSAWDLARALVGARHWAVPAITGTFVLADASLIEPIAVSAELWRWSEPGIFHVPVIGLLGWAMFAAAAVALLQRAGSALFAISAVALAPIATHMGLLLAWWCGFRWLRGEVPVWPWVSVAWVVAIAATIWVIRRRLRARVPVRDMLLRIPGATFFFVLLGVGEPPSALVVYALAFAPPYLALTNLWRPRLKA